MTITTSTQPSDFKSLLIAAFHRARSKGKPNWQCMTVAVLKNRLLNLTGGVFREAAFGGQTLREILVRFPDVVRVEGNSVTLVDASALEAPKVVGAPPKRIRDDIWRAMIDYRTGKKYAWDANQEIVREALPDDEMILPTLDAKEIDKWRADFIEKHGATPELQKWRNFALGTTALPVDLRHSWNSMLTERVSNRATEWLAANNLAPTLVATLPNQQVTSGKAEEALRQIVLDCVTLMTVSELSELRLPPAAVLRAKNAGKMR
ncbi:MAG: hypothetical protein IT462_08555 [Planctomycetes bacterium]|nr:hypothetical protein [Planctomycetota bacterium]